MNTGFAFGATTSAPMFGGTNTNPLSFGAPSAPQTGGLTFGSPAQNAAAPGLNFKPTGTVAPNTGFGGFGAPATSAPTGFTLGAPASTGLSFGAPTTSAPPAFGLPTLGAPASTMASAFGSLGAPVASSAAPTLNFGAPVSQPAAGLSFGATSTPNTGLSFGTPASTAPGLTLGGLAPASSAPLSFGLGGTSLANTTPGLGGKPLNFGAVTSAAPTLNFGGTTQPNLAATTTTKVGLGGIATSTQATHGATVTTLKEVPPREQQIPNEIQQDVDNFKNYIKQQKLYSSDVARCSVKDFRAVESQIVSLFAIIGEVETQLQRNRNLAEKLKYDTAKGLQSLEMAQRTQDTPPGLQYENTAPVKFFIDLADSFEREMHSLKAQIENTDKYVKNFGQPATLTSQDLALGMKRLHDTFVTLAGRLQSVHTQVESQKEMYLNLRKHISSDSSNPFDKLNQTFNSTSIKQAVLHSPPKVACGPTPFSNLANTSNLSMTAQPQQNPPPYSAPNTGGFGFGNTSFGSQPANASSLFGTPNQSMFGQNQIQNNSLLNTSSSFQLQKPPTGNKRGKQ